MYKLNIWRFNILSLLFAVIFEVIVSGQEDIRKQIEQYKNQAVKYENEGDARELTKYLTKLGYLYWQMGALGEAAGYFERSVRINNELENMHAAKTLYNNLGLIYSEKEEYQKAIEYFEKSLHINLSEGNSDAASSDYLNISLALQSLGYLAESNSKAQLALEKALESSNLAVVKSSYGILGENHEKLGNAKEATEYYEKYNTLSKHLQQEEMTAMKNQAKEYEQQVHDKEKVLKNTRDTLGEVLELNRDMQLQNELLNKQNQLNEEQKARMEAREKTRKTQITALIIVSVLFLCIVMLIYRQFKEKKKANILLRDQNAEIEKQKVVLEQQNELVNSQKKRITDSIQYAHRIQKAVLPPENIFRESFKDYFILYRPKDIVSGDFYWVTRKENLFIVAAADCTGHGVPGAFMSMLGVAYLNEIVNKIAINKHISALNADEILNQLREMIISSLHQTGDPNETKDGLDISLCILDFENRSLQYAGANNPLFIIRRKELLILDGDKMPVSFHQKRDIPFTRKEFKLKPDDTIYMFSDGFVDQFGGEQGMKFMAKRFKDLLLKIHGKSMAEQQVLLERELDNWKGERPQLDDVLIIGLRYAPSVPSDGSSGNINWHSKTILIAEDTDMNYFLLTEALKNTQANLVRVKNGQEAIDFVKNNKVDLILMDINMPNMNGYDATKAIKGIRPDIPIIVQTAMHYDDESQEAFKAGADDFISKPIDLKSFIQKMGRFMS